MGIINPDWPVPKYIKAYVTTREHGYSSPPFANFNLGDHVGDTIKNVSANRKLLSDILQLPCQPHWLEQVHGANCLELPSEQIKPHADAAFTRKKNVVCAIMTADCLPILIAHHSQTLVAALHCGWRSLATGIITNTVNKLNCAPADLIVYLGPAISQHAYQVGDEIQRIFVQQHSEYAQAFTKIDKQWHADLYQIARQQLSKLGITAIYGGDYCTYTDSNRFYSYRRDGTCGRMASLIWIHDVN